METHEPIVRAVSGPFHPLYEPKISNRSLSVVYGSITLKFFSGALGTSPHQWFNRGNKIQKKCFLDTLLSRDVGLFLQVAVCGVSCIALYELCELCKVA